MSRSRSSLRRARVAAVVAFLAVLSSACQGQSDDPPGSGPRTALTPSSAPPVLQPGAPGEAGTTADPGTTAEQAGAAHDDIAFMQMMIPHHAQALTMSRLAPRRAASPEVKAMARRILGAQGPEILTMAAWLRDRNLAVPTAEDDPDAYDHGKHGHATMHGMLTAAELRALRRARGAAFDRLYLAGMIRHHEGAIAMADVVAVKGTDVLVAELAGDIVVGQQAEIDRMRVLLADL
ncbi:DUF305 domain-containing protein [Pimelobacter sp. 30-1]|uniref:DUF305 domain-containing protein n=1 Tax=Pimelobacter sp. 30-1 TaxID=2004991 RepID=UPI001C04EADF|nr:DUF305 domain-containing protein [Pimelobacter sp. 30-1]